VFCHYTDVNWLFTLEDIKLFDKIFNEMITSTKSLMSGGRYALVQFQVRTIPLLHITWKNASVKPAFKVVDMKDKGVSLKKQHGSRKEVEYDEDEAIDIVYDDIEETNGPKDGGELLKVCVSFVRTKESSIT